MSKDSTTHPSDVIVRPATLFGKTTDVNQHPLPDVTVTIVELNASTHSDNSGNYFIRGFQPGTYTVLFKRPGYEQFKKTHVTFSAGQTLEMNVPLKKESV